MDWRPIQPTSSSPGTSGGAQHFSHTAAPTEYIHDSASSTHHYSLPTDSVGYLRVTRRSSLNQQQPMGVSMQFSRPASVGHPIFNSGPIRYSSSAAAASQHHHQRQSAHHTSSPEYDDRLIESLPQSRGEKEDNFPQRKVSLLTNCVGDLVRPLSSTLSTSTNSKGGFGGYRLDATESVASTQATGRFAAWRLEAAAAAAHQDRQGATSRSLLSAYSGGGALDSSLASTGGGEDKLFNAACNCGARDQLLKCRSRLERNAMEMNNKVKLAIQRRDRAARGLEDVEGLSRELELAKKDARGKQSGWQLALDDARQTSRELRAQDSQLMTREGALTRRREEIGNLRQRVRSRERQVDELMGETRREQRRLKGELEAAKATEGELVSTVESLRESLSEVRERLVCDDEKLEGIAGDAEVLRSILEEIPSILTEVDSNSVSVDREMKECRERLEGLEFEMEDIEDGFQRLYGRREKSANRLRGLETEKKDLSSLALRLDELQRRVCANESSRSSSRSSVTDGEEEGRQQGSECSDELILLEREVALNDERLKAYTQTNTGAVRRLERAEFQLDVSKRQLGEARAELQRRRREATRAKV
ncbi:hypothetical protein FOL47_008845 [Perkinsus chesapeaki]|uniref:Uncharacterized protein n=1 Tax=Perkinsus chesapeaki TaxID=330153 RepID=A0A7J6LBP9_PERCH|nr:hypothetical protein FOL47_008845 [Perkinsus chesapeaki]